MKVAHTVDVPAAPQEALVSPDGHTAYVSCDSSHKIAAIRTSDWTVEKLIRRRGPERTASPGRRLASSHAEISSGDIRFRDRLRSCSERRSRAWICSYFLSRCSSNPSGALPNLPPSWRNCSPAAGHLYANQALGPDDRAKRPFEAHAPMVCRPLLRTLRG